MTKGLGLDREISSQVGRQVWSEEQYVGTLLNISGKGERPSYSISEPSLLFLLGIFIGKVCGLLSLLGLDQRAGANRTVQ